MHIHESLVGDIRLYALAIELQGRLRAGAALVRHGVELWRVDDLDRPPSVDTPAAALAYAVSVGREMARKRQP